ncbi:MAG: hypothetical protein HDS27_04290 [Bacteroides sp.]|nr:hypothetical protein [Bacteroides sp.]
MAIASLTSPLHPTLHRAAHGTEASSLPPPRRFLKQAAEIFAFADDDL